MDDAETAAWRAWSHAVDDPEVLRRFAEASFAEGFIDEDQLTVILRQLRNGGACSVTIEFNERED